MTTFISPRGEEDKRPAIHENVHVVVKPIKTFINAHGHWLKLNILANFGWLNLN